jgi:hypothetical protein
LKMSLANQNAQMAFSCQFCYGQRCHYDLHKRKLFPHLLTFFLPCQHHRKDLLLSSLVLRVI